MRQKMRMSKKCLWEIPFSVFKRRVETAWSTRTTSSSEGDCKQQGFFPTLSRALRKQLHESHMN